MSRLWIVVVGCVVGISGCQQDQRVPWGAQPDADSGTARDVEEMSSDAQPDLSGDVSADMTADGDVGRDASEVDDGLPPCWRTEQSSTEDACRGEHAEDQDGDGLSACQETHLGLDPEDPDTDGDGVLDDEELRLCLDPTDADKPTDRQRWILDACEERPKESGIQLMLAANGMWNYASGPRTEGFSSVEYAGDRKWVAMSTFQMPGIDGFGVVVSFPESISTAEHSLSESLGDLVDTRMSNLGEAEKHRDVEIPYAPGRASSRWGLYEVQPGRSTGTSEIGLDLAFELSRLDRGNFAGTQYSTDATSTAFTVGVGVFAEDREDCGVRPSGERYMQAVIGVAPNDEMDSASDEQTLRTTTSIRRLNWGKFTLHPYCRRFPLAAAPVIRSGTENEDRQFRLQFGHRWIPGSQKVRVAGGEVPLGEDSGYRYEMEDHSVLLSESAFGEQFPSNSHRFAAFQAQAWLQRCRPVCDAPETCRVDDL